METLPQVWHRGCSRCCHIGTSRQSFKHSNTSPDISSYISNFPDIYIFTYFTNIYNSPSIPQIFSHACLNLLASNVFLKYSPKNLRILFQVLLVSKYSNIFRYIVSYAVFMLGPNLQSGLWKCNGSTNMHACKAVYSMHIFFPIFTLRDAPLNQFCRFFTSKQLKG